MMRCHPRIVSALLAGFLTSLAWGGPAAAASADYTVQLSPQQFSVSNPSEYAAGFQLALGATGSAWTFVTTTGTTRRLSFYVDGYPCDGVPTLAVAVDGMTLMTRDIYGSGRYAVVGVWPAGRHQVTFRLLNGHHTSACTRRLGLSYMSLFAHTDGTADPVASLQRADVIGSSTYTPASAGSGQELKAVGTMAVREDSQGATSLYLAYQALPDCYSGNPRFTVTVDGVTAYSGPAPLTTVDRETTGALTVPYAVANGVHDLTVSLSGVTPNGNGCAFLLDLELLEFHGWV